MSKTFNRFIFLALTAAAAAGIFAYAFRPLATNDIFFGLKIGEVIINTRHISTREPFSWSALGRPIIMYEWLAQTFLYLIFKLGGFTALEIYTAFMATLFFLLSIRLLRSLPLALFLTLAIFEFFVPRPHLIALILLILFIQLIFNYLKSSHSSKFLWLTLPLTYIWTNSHASFIFIPYLFFTYALLNRSHRLAIFGFLNLFITLLPPMWYKPYLLLWHFITHIDILTQTVSEWGSLGRDVYAQYFYLSLTGFTLVITLTSFLKSKRLSTLLLSAPLIAIMLISLQAVRHIAFGTISAVVVLALSLPRRLPLVLTTSFIAATIWLFISKPPPARPSANWQTQVLAQDIDFLKAHSLQGHMFNDFALGSYLLYYLYPQYQVFFDSRADVYFCCELKDFSLLLSAKKSSPDDFRQTVAAFLDKYKFSYLVIPYTSYNPMEFTTATRMADILLNDPHWRLIYASDDWQVLLKNDGLNQKLWDTQGATAATPYRLNEFRSGQEGKAQLEYEKLIEITDSGIAQNGLGFSLLVQQKYADAKTHFERAVELNPYLGKPHLGLGKITKSRDHLETAIKLSPYLGEAYLILAQIYLDQNNPPLAKSTLNAGLSENIDLLSRQKIVQLLNQLR